MNAIIAKIKNILAEDIIFSDSTVGNASTSNHGYFPKLPGTPGSGFWRADGVWAATGAGDITGTTGSTDNALLRADGTGGATFQGSPVVVDDSGSVNIPAGQKYKINNTALAYTDITGAGTVTATSGALTSAALLGGNGTTDIKVITDIPTADTIGGAYIYRASGTDVPVTDGGTGVSTLAAGGLLTGTGATAVNVVAPGTTAQILVGGGAATAPLWGTDIPTAVTIGAQYIYRAGGTDVPIADGGTGISTYPKRTIFLSAAGGVASTTQGDGGYSTTETSTNKVNFRGISFAAGVTTAYHQWGLVMPLNYDGGTVVCTPIYLPVTSNASNHTIIFGMQAVSLASTETRDVAWGTTQESSYTVAADQSAALIFGPATSALTIGGTSPAGGEYTLWRCYRKGATDSYTGAVILLGWKIVYTTNGTSDE